MEKEKRSDFIFKMNSDFDKKTSSFALSFTNANDGLQELIFDQSDQSVFKWPFLSPTDSYKSTLNKYTNYISDGRGGWGHETNSKKNMNYIFRTRTKVDVNGKIISANYGRITGEFNFDIYKDRRNIRFLYHFNPDNKSRSLEFNGENHFKDRDEQGRKR